MIVDSSTMHGVHAGQTAHCISCPVGGKFLALLPVGSFEVDAATLRHEDHTTGEYIQFTTPEAIALAEYQRIRGF